MGLYDRLDIALDTIPFNSGTTAFDALWMGVPLVALEGNWSGGKMASSILKAFDRKEWIAQDEEEYVSIVCTLARDVEGRRELRKSQRARMADSPLCDAQGVARALEDALEGMYDRWAAGDRSKVWVLNADCVPLQS
jgi:predicted O-linked N-acetylglucosamine transferase (SPINDLY family)